MQGTRSYPVAGPASVAACLVRLVRSSNLSTESERRPIMADTPESDARGLANPAARASPLRLPPIRDLLHAAPPRAMQKDEKRSAASRITTSRQGGLTQ